MHQEHEVAALIEQAARNIEALEHFIDASGSGAERLAALRERLERLKVAYTTETHAVTRYALSHAIDRRRRGDRRRHEPD